MVQGARGPGHVLYKRHGLKLLDHITKLCSGLNTVDADERDMVQGARGPGHVLYKRHGLKLLDHITKFCSGLNTVDADDIPQVMKTLFGDANGIPHFINAMEVSQQKSKRAKLVIHDEYMHAVALKLLLQSGEYDTET